MTQRVAQVRLTLAVIGQQRFGPGEILAQPVDLSQRVLVIVRGLGQEGHHFGLVEASECRLEARLPQIERGDTHHPTRR